MDGNLLGEQIAKFRKAANLTQDELGRAVGVSAQAVSRWECGGTPDVALLPAIAKRLGVTIDALFGREREILPDAEDTVRRWIVTVPKGLRLKELCRLVWSAMGPLVLGDYEAAPEFNRKSRCECIDEVDGKSFPILRRTSIFKEDGLVFGVNADDMSFVSIWPEPEAGFEAFMTKNDWCRALFRALAEPHCLELLEYLESKPARDSRRYTPGAVAKALGISPEEAERAVETLAKANLLELSELETENGPIHSFRLWANNTLVPFLYLARCLLEGRPPITTAGRAAPILRGEKWKEKENN